MSYIAPETVKVIRNKIKQAFPACKFSITREHHSTVRVVLLASALDLPESVNVNEYHTDRIENVELRALVNKLLEIIESVDARRYRETGDYGSQPNYYISIKVGEYGNPYKRKVDL